MEATKPDKKVGIRDEMTVIGESTLCICKVFPH